MRSLLLALLVLGAACGGESADEPPTASGPPPADIVQAFEDQGLPAGNPRDNTGSCTYPDDSEGSCVALTTTDQVSVYQWPSSEAAEAWATGETCDEPFLRENGGAKCDEVIGSYVLRLGGDIDFPVPDAQPYVDAARAVIQE